jgi:hypothetical protein
MVSASGSGENSRVDSSRLRDSEVLTMRLSPPRFRLRILLLIVTVFAFGFAGYRWRQWRRVYLQRAAFHAAKLRHIEAIASAFDESSSQSPGQILDWALLEDAGQDSFAWSIHTIPPAPDSSGITAADFRAVIAARRSHHARLERKYELLASQPWRAAGTDPTAPPRFILLSQPGVSYRPRNRAR